MREEGTLAATVAVLEGQARVGLSADELERLAADPAARKVSLRDLPVAPAQKVTGGTTVAATLHLAHRAGIRVFATGGIGGVHRGHPEDVSVDLPALAATPLVVCAGAKAILDLPRTPEYLETHGVPVIGYGADFPAFYSRRSGLVDKKIPHQQCGLSPRTHLSALFKVHYPLFHRARFRVGCPRLRRSAKGTGSPAHKTATGQSAPARRRARPHAALSRWPRRVARRLLR